MRRPSWHAACRRGLLALALWAGLAAQGAAPSDYATAHTAPLEARVRAAFLFNFARFTQWPGDNGQGLFDFCVVGDATLHRVLTETLAGKDVSGHTPRVRMLREPAQGADCELLYLPQLPEQERHTWLEGASGAPVLTVSEGREFVRRGGMIGFHLVERRLRFAINPRTVHEAGMQMSSRLLGLADIEGGAQ